MKNNMYGDWTPESEREYREFWESVAAFDLLGWASNQPIHDNDPIRRGRRSMYGARPQAMGPTTRMRAYEDTRPTNTRVVRGNPVSGLGGYYVPRRFRRGVPFDGSQQRTFGEDALNFGGAMVAKHTSVAHELVHRLQDSDLNPDRQFMREFNDIMNRASSPNTPSPRDFNPLTTSGIGPRETARVEAMAYLLGAPGQVPPERFMRHLGLDRDYLMEYERPTSNDPDLYPAEYNRRIDNISVEIRDALERLARRRTNTAHYERAARRIEPPVTRGRGRPTYE